MSPRLRTRWRPVLALIAAVATLVVFNAVVLHHWHNGPQGRSCDICRSGQLPTPEPSLRIEIQSPALVEWRQPSSARPSIFEPVFAASSPRAPPA
jgi:hypothetical protein